MEQSNVFLSNANFDLRKNTFVMCSVIEKSRHFQYEASILAEEVPSFVNKTTEKFGYKEFHSNDFLQEDGTISSVRTKDSVPLGKMFAYWYPNDHSNYNKLLKGYFQRVRDKDKEVVADTNLNENSYQVLDIEDLVKIIHNNKVLFFTGAGISMSKGIPNLDEFSNFVEHLFQPIGQLFNDILAGETSNRLKKAKEFKDSLYYTKPSTSHWLIAEISKKYNIGLATGNFDGLHEKTGVKAIFQNDEEIVIPDLDKYDVLVTIGLSENGIGKVVDVFKESQDNKKIIAINTMLPKYITEKDYFIEGDADHILTRLWECMDAANRGR